MPQHLPKGRMINYKLRMVLSGEPKGGRHDHPKSHKDLFSSDRFPVFAPVVAIPDTAKYV